MKEIIIKEAKTKEEKIVSKMAEKNAKQAVNIQPNNTRYLLELGKIYLKRNIEEDKFNKEISLNIFFLAFIFKDGIANKTLSILFLFFSRKFLSSIGMPHIERLIFCLLSSIQVNE